MAEVEVESSAPDDDPSWKAIEAVLRETLKDYAGSWRLRIRPARVEPWWVVAMERTDGEFKNTIVLDPRDQTAPAIRATLTEALKGAV